MAFENQKRALEYWVFPFLLLAPSAYFLFAPDIWRSQWYTGLAVIMAVIALGVFVPKFSPRIGTFLASAWWYFAFQGFELAFSAKKLPPLVKWLSAAQGSFYALVTLGTALVPKPIFRKLLDGFAVLCLLSSGALVFRYFSGPYANSIIGNSAADASFIAAMAPLVWARHSSKIWPNTFLVSTLALFLPVVAVILAGSSTGVAALIVAALSIAAVSTRNRRAVGISCAAIILVTLSAFFFMKEDFFNDNGRFRIWGLHLNALFSGFQNVRGLEAMVGVRSPEWLFGAGGGTFIAYAGSIQSEGHQGIMTAFLFAHNEWVQIFFEYGAAGLLLAIGIFLYALRKAVDRPWLFSALFTYGFISLTQYPLRFFVPALFGACLLREAFLDSRDAGEIS